MVPTGEQARPCSLLLAFQAADADGLAVVGHLGQTEVAAEIHQDENVVMEMASFETQP